MTYRELHAHLAVALPESVDYATLRHEVGKHTGPNALHRADAIRSLVQLGAVKATRDGARWTILPVRN